LLDVFAKNNLFDIHIEPAGSGYCIRTRINGKLQLVEKVNQKVAENLINQLKSRGGLSQASPGTPLKASFVHDHLLIQFFSLPTLGGEKVYLRLINQNSISKDLSKLGLYGDELKALEGVNKLGSGLVIVLGEGKTTTMFSLLSRFDPSKLNLSTVERHASYKLPNVNQFVAHNDYHSLAHDALNAAINQRSDVVLVEDIGTPELAKLAVDSATRGKLIITSLPIDDSFKVPQFLASLGVKPFLIASSLRLIVRQRIVHTSITSQLEPRPIGSKESQQILKDYDVDIARLHDLEKQAKANGLGEKLALSTSEKAITKLFDVEPEKLTKITGIFEVVPATDTFRHSFLAGTNSLELKDSFTADGGVNLELDYLIKALRKIVPFIKLE
jgi:type II secretory ATPase GspE/PulE/Tfp pilus assembly ATPase PilB-like protein